MGSTGEARSGRKDLYSKKESIKKGYEETSHGMLFGWVNGVDVVVPQIRLCYFCLHPLKLSQCQELHELMFVVFKKAEAFIIMSQQWPNS